jgi:hypothetical protein
MIKWPRRAKEAIKKLFEPLQDIDVYVEDCNDEVFYSTLLKRVSQGKVKIVRVFALEGRESVIKAAMQYDHSIRKALFIIDGDLDWVSGSPTPNVAGLHRLDAYCIENLLLCERALTQILVEDIVISEDDAGRNLDFNSWIISIQDPLLELFSAFAIAKIFIPHKKTVSCRVGNLCSQSDNKTKTLLDLSKVLKVKNEVLTAAKSVVDENIVNTTYQNMYNRLKRLPIPLYAVSGKDYLFPLLHFLIQPLGCRITTKSLRIRLAKNGDVLRFSGLNEAIINASLS